MTSWLLVVVVTLLADPGVTTSQIGPFADEAACTAAGAAVKKLEFRSRISFVCTPTATHP